MPEIKTSSDHPASMAERVNKRLRNSGAGAKPDVTVQTGNSPQRAFHNIHHSGSAGKHGSDNRGEGDISGNRRGDVR
jgi:hypothetical protein